MRKHISASIFIIFSFVCSSLFAQSPGSQQFQHSFTIGNKHPAAIIIVGPAWQSQNINSAMMSLSNKANTLFNNLSLSQKGSWVEQLSEKKRGKHQINPEFAIALDHAIKIASWSDGAFDATNGNYKSVTVNTKKNLVNIKSKGTKFNLDPILEGILADYIVKEAGKLNFQDVIVKVNMTFRSVGRAPSGPWKIQIQDSEGTFAHHALNLTLGNVGVSAFSATQYKDTYKDPRDGSRKPLCKGVAVMAKEATTAEGIANAIFNLGPAKGLELLNKLPNAKGIIVDFNGGFYRSTGF